MKTALVTGSAGFVGRHMATALEAAGYDVWCCDSVNGAECRDLANPLAVTLGYRPTYDLVVHCAALVDGREAIENKAALLAAYNLQLDGAMFEWALRARPGRIVYFSSSAAYPTVLQNGRYAGHRLAERDIDPRVIGAPDATYGWVKLTGERLAAEVRAAGIPVTVVRPFSGYGEDQDACYPFPAMIARAVAGERPFTVWGDGQQVRDFIHIDDIVGGVLALVDQEIDGPVNLGTGRATSMDQLAMLAMAAANTEAPVRHLTDKPVGVRWRVADTTLMRRYYQPAVALEAGISRAIAACSTR